MLAGRDAQEAWLALRKGSGHLASEEAQHWEKEGLGTGLGCSRPPQGSARRGRCDRHLHPGLPKAPIH